MSKRIETFLVPWGEHREKAIQDTLSFLGEKREYKHGKVHQTWWEHNKVRLVEVLACRPYRRDMERELDEYSVLPYPHLHEVKWVVEICVRY